jgi:transcriptional regulator with XRE-family HTH domain
MQPKNYTPQIKIVLNNIIRERNQLGYTQEYMGLKMGISQHAYSKIELGLTRISVQHFFQIANILNCPLQKLLDGTE